jgi:hypothetical protein
MVGYSGSLSQRVFAMANAKIKSIKYRLILFSVCPIINWNKCTLAQKDIFSAMACIFSFIYLETKSPTSMRCFKQVFVVTN